jgi:hypothetical protein
VGVACDASTLLTPNAPIYILGAAGSGGSSSGTNGSSGAAASTYNCN